MADNNFKVFVGDNFKVEGQDVLPVNDKYLKTAGVYFDERAYFLTRNLNLSNWQWYFNYLDFMQTAASKNPKAKPMYLLDLGYVPVVYMPSCCLKFGTELMEALDSKDIPHVKIAPTSFVRKYCDIMTVDAWVSKMDVAEPLGLKPENVTSEAIIRRLILNE